MNILKALSNSHVCEQSQSETGCAQCGINGLVSDTKVLTQVGWRAVEMVRPGDRIQTFENGFQSVLQVDDHLIWHEPVDCPECVCPFHVPKGAIGNNKAMILPSDNKVVLKCNALIPVFGQAHVLVNAQSLVEFAGVRRQDPPPKRRIYQLRFDKEEMVIVQGGAVVSCPTAHQFLDIFAGSGEVDYSVEMSRIPRLSDEQADAVISCIETELAEQNRKGLPPLFESKSKMRVKARRFIRRGSAFV